VPIEALAPPAPRSRTGCAETRIRLTLPPLIILLTRQKRICQGGRDLFDHRGEASSMVGLRFRNLASISVTAAMLAAPLALLVADSAIAAGALFRVRRIYWTSNVDSWTSGFLIPPSGKSAGMSPYQPPASAYVGKTAKNPRFTAPKSFIKNTTYYFACGPGTFQCYPGYPESKGWYSYWNAKGSFRPQNPNAPQSTTTLRFRTTMSNPNPTTNSPHTAMYNPVTPTTTWGGRYDASRGGSIMIWPGNNRFGGTMRYFEGPNSRGYQLITIEGPYSTATFPPSLPLSQQIGTGVEFVLGEVEGAGIGFRYRLTEPNHAARLVVGTTPEGGLQYYVREAHYLVTRAPYTTGMARAWEPLGNTNTIQTATGYDNRTAAGLNGTISMVHPRLFHAYLVLPPTSGVPIKMVWSSARLRAIDFRFMPEPTAVAVLALGFATLTGLYRLRRR
jgi:hypothetical protein